MLPKELLIGGSLYLLCYFSHLLALVMGEVQLSNYLLIAMSVFVLYAFGVPAVKAEIRAGT